MKCRARSGRLAQTLRLLGAIAAAAAIPGCTVIRVGRLADASALERSLHPGTSDRQEVKRVLGEPYGAAGVMFPGMDRPRDAWVYYYEEASLSEDRRQFIFVFFNQQKYDGYMWFSSLPSSTGAAAE